MEKLPGYNLLTFLKKSFHYFKETKSCNFRRIRTKLSRVESHRLKVYMTHIFFLNLVFDSLKHELSENWFCRLFWSHCMKRLIVLLFPRMGCKSVTATLKEFRGGLLVHFETVLASIAASICILPDENIT